MKPLSFEIRNVEGVHELEVQLTPGVTELLGSNGAGKTSAMRAIVAASGGKDTHLTVRDGAPRGSVQAGGLTLAVGRTTRSTGEPAVELADVGLLADLIRPSIKDPEARNKVRLKAVSALHPITIDDETLLALAGGNEVLAAAVQSQGGVEGLSLFDAAELVRRVANALALEQEKRQGAAQGAAAALGDRLKAFDYFSSGGEAPDGEPDALSAEVEQLAREAGVVRAQAAARQQLEARQAEIRGSLGERPDVEAEATTYRRILAEIGELEAKLAGLRSDLEASRLRGAALRLARERYDEQARILSQPPQGPTFAEADAADAALTTAQERLAAARDFAAFQDLKRERSAQLGLADEAAAEAVHFRGLVKSLPEAIAVVLQRQGLPGLTIEGGRLAWVDETTGEIKDFDTRLSFGQQVRAALRVALPAHRDSGQPVVLPLDPNFWLALDEDSRKELAAAAVGAGVYVVTERPETGELRARHVGVS